VLQKAAPLRDGGAWALLYVLFEKNSGFLVCLAGSSGALSGLERFSLASDPSVALETEERLTSNRRVASALNIPRSKVATIFLRRSSE
jgi:hypothetical protein